MNFSKETNTVGNINTVDDIQLKDMTDFNNYQQGFNKANNNQANTNKIFSNDILSTLENMKNQF